MRTYAVAAQRLKLLSHCFSIDHPDQECGEQLMADTLGLRWGLGITELYLGSAMDKPDKEDILGKAKAPNPNIHAFQARRGAGGAIAFEPDGNP